MLVQHSLWPEEHKLYGHGYEMFCCAASPDSRLVASACRSSDPASARVLLWDTNTWEQVGGLASESSAALLYCVRWGVWAGTA